ncbi:hypothetical protein [Arsukibacterium ikkense]|uniref:hypothetical protein n=1 Tax=Arsukibacterium ikkense TaxID=336831 RepID=UPI00128D2756|nr:hypothetical protein [Arsukibacterium ikkense]
MPDYSRFTLEELLETQKQLNVEEYPEQANELERLIANKQEPLSGKEAPTQEIIWLKKPVSTGLQNFWLYSSIAVIILLPLFFIGDYVPSYSTLHSYNGKYNGMQQTYSRNGVELYNLHVADRTFKVNGTWQKLLGLELGTRVRVMSSSGGQVWEIRSVEGGPVVSYSEFVRHSEKRQSDKKVQAYFFLFIAIFGFVLYSKLKRRNRKLLQLKVPGKKQGD